MAIKIHNSFSLKNFDLICISKKALRKLKHSFQMFPIEMLIELCTEKQSFAGHLFGSLTISQTFTSVFMQRYYQHNLLKLWYIIKC